MEENKLSENEFAQVIKNTPLVSIDFIIRDREGRVLLMKRKNEPAIGDYFVPGGRIKKNQKIRDVFRNKLKEETGLQAELESAKFLGHFEHFYRTNYFKDPSYGSHYVVLAYELQLKTDAPIILDKDHSEVLWLSESELRKRSDVNQYVKDFFNGRR